MKTKEEIQNYIPKDKFDNYHIDHMLELSSEEIEPIVADLLFWLKDMNLLVTKELVAVLVKNEEVVRPHVIGILDNTKEDTIWKYNLINNIILNLDAAVIKNYEVALKRIVDKPTKLENHHETNTLANKALQIMK